MFTQLMRESRIYGHNKAHLESCSKCKGFKIEFEKNKHDIDMEKFDVMIEYEKGKIKAYKDNTDIFLGYKLQSKYFINKHFREDIHISIPYNIIINKDNLTQVLLEKIDDLPNKFVIKKNKLSGYTVIVDKLGQILYQGTKYKYSTANLYEILSTVVRYDYDKNPEKETDDDKMDLFIEEYVEVDEEYKFHCMHGKVVMIEHYLISSGLYNNKWYTRNWQELDLIGRDDPYPYVVYPNKKYYEYVKVAEKIASKVNLDYVRVDTFTTKNGLLFFGEISHSPNAFHNNYSPIKFDKLLYELYTKEQNVDDVNRLMLPFLVFDKKHSLIKQSVNVAETGASVAETTVNVEHTEESEALLDFM